MRLIGVLLMALALAGCTKRSDKKTLWIYTSLYKDVIAQMETKLRTRFPDVDFKWYQSGSENVAARLGAELASGKTLADLVMTSDPFWYLELKAAGHLLPYESKAAERVPDRFRDKDKAFTIVRVPTVVMARNTQAVPPGTEPKSWKELLDPKWTGKISMGSPLESGTSFTAVAQLVKKEGWGYFETLRRHGLLAAGGNSAVISRMETKERPVGIVLLENVLEAKKRGSPLEPIYPTDGAILAPSLIAILAKTPNPDLAKAVYDYFFDDEMQRANLEGRMYSPIPGFASPEGAREFKDVLASSFTWGPEVLESLYAQRESIKKQFLDVVLN